MMTTSTNNSAENIMAKAIALYHGSNTYGVNVEVAKDINGQWYSREYGWNGYGRGWSKWSKDRNFQHPTQLRNMVEYGDAPEYKTIPEEQRVWYVEYGFNLLRLAEEGHLRIRLPKD
jgi:hypothetical protein